MKKMSKRFVALLLAAVMVMGLSITTFASTNDTHQVTIYVKSIYRNANGAVVASDDLVSNPIVVTVNHGQSYKDAINAACNMDNSVITNAYWNGEYLRSLDVNSLTYSNIDSYPSPNRYEGYSWMYFNNTTIPSTTNSYPNVSLQNAKVNSNVTFTLSYEYLIYTW